MMAFPRWLVLYKGTEGSPIMRLECQFRAQEGCEDEYALKIVKALEPAIEIDSGPWPLDLLVGTHEPLVSDDKRR